MKRSYLFWVVIIFAALSLSLNPLANADVTVIGQNPGQTTVSVIPTELIQLNINSTSTVTPNETWFCFKMIKGGVQGPVYLITSQGTIVPSAQVTDFSKVTYNFGSGPYTTIGTLTMQSLGLNSGDTLIYGYAVSDSDISHVQIPNIVVVNVQDTTSMSSIKIISGGQMYSLAIKRDGTLWGWGDNTYGEIGNGTSDSNTYIPEQIGTGTNWEMVSAAGDNQVSVALKSDGTLWTWGSGSLGLGINTGSEIKPTQIGTDTWRTVCAGYAHILAIKSDGTLWAWGNGSYGALGTGDTNGEVPAQVGTDTNWIEVSAGTQDSMAIKSNGTLWGWGLNFSGELGDGTLTMRGVPEQIGSDTNWAAVSIGYGFTIGLKSDGTLWAWGTRLSRSETRTYGLLPSQIGTDTNWVAISAGSNFALALKSDGTLWAWGTNDQGQLGDGLAESQVYNPKQIGSDNNWVAISAGYAFAIAIKSDGTLWAWGDNGWGQLGDGSTESRAVPWKIGTDSNW